MSELEIFLIAFGAGSLSALLMALIMLEHVKWCYNEKLAMLQMQIVALQVDRSDGVCDD